MRRGSSALRLRPVRPMVPCSARLYATAAPLRTGPLVRARAPWVLAGAALGLGVGLELLAPSHADDDSHTDGVEVQLLTSPTSNATFPIYRTREDVLYWMQNYYKQPDAALLKLAAESLAKDRMKLEDGWLLTGLLAGIVKHSPESLSHFAIRDIYSALQDYKQALLVGLWLAGHQGKEYLEKLADDVPEEAVKQTIQKLLRTPPPDPLFAEMNAANFNMNLHVLMGMFYATGDTAVVDKLIDVCRDWSAEVLTKGGREGAARFYVAKNAREKLAVLCQEHERAREACKRALSAQGETGPLTEEQRAMLTGILDAVERLGAKEGDRNV